MIVSEENIFSVGKESFDSLALQLFDYQSKHNKVYKKYLDLLGIDPKTIKLVADIPLLPIEFFKSFEIKTENFTPELIFLSSGTNDMGRSKHFVKNGRLYEKSFLTCYGYFFGQIKDTLVIAFLPNYLEQGNSSLVYMTKELIRRSQNKNSGFYDFREKNWSTVLHETSKEQKIMILGVSYALLDLAEKFPIQLPKNSILIETGGMKGRRKEMVREEMHQKLKEAFGLQKIHSEYGMTEILSQAYSLGKGLFSCPPWMKVVCKNIYDPLGENTNKKGRLGIIDLANVHSCSFLQTNDLGIIYPNGMFEVLGRTDHSDLRGCNLMYT